MSLIKKIIIKRNIIDNFENPIQTNVIFKRSKIKTHTFCYDRDGEKYYECKYNKNCTLKYTCFKINSKSKTTNYEYIPTV